MLLVVNGCVSVKTSKNAPILLKANDRLPATALIEKVNSFKSVNTIKANASLRLIDLKLSEQGKVEPYRPADALIVLERPELIRLLIRVPIIKQNIADMTSDGEHFRIAIYYPEKYKRFLIGSNNRSYEDRLEKMPGSEKVQQQLSSVVRVRPQHITDAVLVQPIDLSNDKLHYFVEDVTREEVEERPGQASRRVIRTYQVLSVLEALTGGELRVLRQFWFDRTDTGLPLVRMLIYENDGTITAEVAYRKYQNYGAAIFPHQIEIVRARDNYALELNFDNVTENDTIERRAFVLENTEKLPEKDLDATGQALRASPEQ